MTNKSVFFVPAAAIIIDPRAAKILANAALQGNEYANKHGARLTPAALSIASDILSAIGTTEPPRTPTPQAIEYERIDSTTAAELLGCSPRNVRKLAEQQRLPGDKQHGIWTFNRDDVICYRDYRDGN